MEIKEQQEIFSTNIRVCYSGTSEPLNKEHKWSKIDQNLFWRPTNTVVLRVRLKQ
jgi:hypothetical protein